MGRWASPHHVATEDQRSPICTVPSVVDGPSPSSRVDTALIVVGAFETVEERIALLVDAETADRSMRRGITPTVTQFPERSKSGRSPLADDRPVFTAVE